MKPLYTRNFAIAFAANMLFTLANAMLAHYARWITALGGDERTVGWITGLGFIAGLALRPSMGPWIDRIGDRTSLAIGCAVYLATWLLNPFLSGIGPAIFVLRAITLASAALVFASSLTYITRASPPERRTEAIGSLGAGGFVGILFGPALGDLLLSDVAPHRDEFLPLFLAGACAVGLSLLLVAFLRPSRRAAAPVRSVPFLQTILEYWPGRILLVNVTFGVCMTSLFVFLARFVDAMGLVEVGPFFLAYAGWGLFLRLAVARRGEVLDSRKIVVVGLCFFAAGMFAFSWVAPGHPLRLLLPAVLCGTGHALTFHHMVGLTIEPFPESAHGVGSVLALMMLDLGQIAGAPLLGTIGYYAGLGWVYPTVGLVCLLAGAALLVPTPKTVLVADESVPRMSSSGGGKAS